MNDGQKQRVYEITGTRTQVQLAEVLGIKQSSISDAIKRKCLPDSWLVTLYRKYKVNPDWLLTGEGSRYLKPVGEAPTPPSDLLVKREQAILVMTYELWKSIAATVDAFAMAHNANVDRQFSAAVVVVSIFTPWDETSPLAAKLKKAASSMYALAVLDKNEAYVTGSLQIPGVTPALRGYVTLV